MSCLKGLSFTGLALLLLSACAMARAATVDHRGRPLTAGTLGATAYLLAHWRPNVNA